MNRIIQFNDSAKLYYFATNLKTEIWRYNVE